MNKQKHMAQRRKNGAAEIEFIVILAAVGGLGYLLYKTIQGLPKLPSLPPGPAGDAQAAADVAAAQADPSVSWWMNHPNLIVPGTGQSVSYLQSIGWTPAEIQQMYVDALNPAGTNS